MMTDRNGNGKLRQRSWDVLSAVWNPMYLESHQGRHITSHELKYLDLLIVQSRHTPEIQVVKNRFGENGVMTLADALKWVHKAKARHKEIYNFSC